MGNRVKGKAKRKSIKAASHSGMGSRRKLSRMGKRRKKNHSGLDATFIGRAACLRRLQVSLKDFRRLCILKGVYPREPRGRAPGNKKGQVYYHIKDVRAIAHEPVLEKFREFRAFMKKVRRAAGRNEKDEAARKHARAPSYTLHHLVRERYPRFVDALNDLDDALSLVYLFAALPSDGDIRSKVTNKAKTLAAAWGSYCATTCCVTKSFISVKGVYIESNIQGSTIRWVVPHSFTQNMPEAVDYKVMLTFFEFYETLLSFVLYKLYNDLGVRYPLSIKDLAGETSGNTSSVLATNLKAFSHALAPSSNNAVSKVVSESLESTATGDMPKARKPKASQKSKELIKSVGAALSKLKDEDSDDDEVDNDDDNDVDIAGPFAAALETMVDEEERVASNVVQSLDDEAIKRRRLFSGLTFFFSREIPRGYLEIVSLAFGAQVGWEGANSPISASHPSITHHFVDRPKLPSSYDALPKSREFVQPQWILDCANNMFLLPISKYGVGLDLPPHLSPWVDDEEEGYKPAYATVIERLKNGETLDEIAADADNMDVTKVSDSGVAEDSSDDEQAFGKKSKAESESDQEDDEEEQEEEEDEGKRKRKEERDQKEAHDLAKVMMSKKANRLYNRMKYGLEEKKTEVEKLRRRREDVKGKQVTDGKTVLKQKVERLKSERKAIEKEYSATGGSMKKRKRTK